MNFRALVGDPFFDRLIKIMNESISEIEREKIWELLEQGSTNKRLYKRVLMLQDIQDYFNHSVCKYIMLYVLQTMVNIVKLNAGASSVEV
jgi:hypothetical protein